GEGRQRRDFNFVTDVVEALLGAAASDHANGQIFNLGQREHVNLAQLAALLVKLNGGGNYELIPFPEDRKAIDIGDYYADFGKIEQSLGWKPTVTLEKGLKETLEYYWANHAHYWE